MYGASLSIFYATPSPILIFTHNTQISLSLSLLRTHETASEQQRTVIHIHSCLTWHAHIIITTLTPHFFICHKLYNCSHNTAQQVTITVSFRHTLFRKATPNRIASTRRCARSANDSIWRFPSIGQSWVKYYIAGGRSERCQTSWSVSFRHRFTAIANYQ